MSGQQFTDLQLPRTIKNILSISLSLLKLSLKMFTMVTASGCKMKNKQLIYNTYTNTFYSTHFITDKLGKRVLLRATMKITYQIKIIN